MADTHECSREDKVSGFLRKPSSYAGRVSDVGVIETHCARVFLAGDKAYKVKKPVRLPFLDFSTLGLRRKALEREFELNKPHAAGLYLRLVPITLGDDGVLELGGPGAPIEWALEMQRFDQAHLLSHIAASGPLPRAICFELAEMAARYHLSSRPDCGADGAGLVERTLLPLIAELADADGHLQTDTLPAFERDAKAALSHVADLLAQRAKTGAVRRCHGDLHLGNIVMIDGHPLPFDALEFDESLATTDVLYDLAFLLMDLAQRGDAQAANLVLNAYVTEAPIGTEIEGLRCLPLFLAVRAAVRAMVGTTRAGQVQGSARAEAAREARGYFERAAVFLNPPAPTLVAVGGFSGSGKSTLAALIAPSIGPSPGALHLRSDVERKRLFGVAEEERLSTDHYRPEVSDEVYALLFNKAGRALAAGHAVIIDAVFAKESERAAVAAIAERSGVSFTGLWLEAPADILLERVEVRRGDASDADARVVRDQLSRSVGKITWQRLDARGAREDMLSSAVRVLQRSSVRPGQTQRFGIE